MPKKTAPKHVRRVHVLTTEEMLDEAEDCLDRHHCAHQTASRSAGMLIFGFAALATGAVMVDSYYAPESYAWIGNAFRGLAGTITRLTTDPNLAATFKQVFAGMTAAATEEPPTPKTPWWNLGDPSYWFKVKATGETHAFHSTGTGSSACCAVSVEPYVILEMPDQKNRCAVCVATLKLAGYDLSEDIPWSPKVAPRSKKSGTKSKKNGATDPRHGEVDEHVALHRHHYLHDQIHRAPGREKRNGAPKSAKRSRKPASAPASS